MAITNISPLTMCRHCRKNKKKPIKYIMIMVAFYILNSLNKKHLTQTFLFSDRNHFNLKSYLLLPEATLSPTKDHVCCDLESLFLFSVWLTIHLHLNKDKASYICSWPLMQFFALSIGRCYGMNFTFLISCLCCELTLIWNRKWLSQWKQFIQLIKGIKLNKCKHCTWHCLNM